jgi:hypothetical protein
MKEIPFEELKVGQVIYMNPGLTGYYVLPDVPVRQVAGKAARDIAKGEIVEYCRDADTKDILTVSTKALPVEPMSLINRRDQDSR